MSLHDNNEEDVDWALFLCLRDIEQSYHENIREIKRLLDEGADANNKPHDYCLSMLMRTIYRPECVSTILLRILVHSGADVEYVGRCKHHRCSSYSPLTRSVQNMNILNKPNYLMQVQTLLESNANPLLEDNYDRKATYYFARYVRRYVESTYALDMLVGAIYEN